ncbi:MAG: DUF4170 domain-containing protein [Rhodospirillaceae bacterium]|nr:DUF4170 domain-containing protein [Rhodospirillaceae bacterium]
MTAQRYYVVGGEYADTSFTVPAPGTQLETHGPFSEREAKVCWRDLTGRTVDNAMVRYVLKAEAQAGGKSYWVVGGEYADTSFTRMQTNKELEVYGPFDKWDAALGFWRGMTSKSVDDALVRYDIRENYQPGEGVRPAARPKAKMQLTETKSVAIAAPPEKVFAFVMDGANWPAWAIHNVKAMKPGQNGVWDMETARGPGKVTLRGDAASGVIDEVFVDAQGVTWNVPWRVMAAGGGTVVVMVFTKPPSFTEGQFLQGMAQMDDELEALKKVLESA